MKFFFVRKWKLATLLIFSFALILTSNLGVSVSLSLARSEHAVGGVHGSLSTVEQRIRRIQDGLLLPVVVTGEPRLQMKLADRMQFHKTPGVSVAFINNGRVEWARAYGVREAGSAEAVTTETLFQAGSISKAVTAMA